MSGHTVYLVRHGEAASTWGQHADPALSDLGRQQAGAAADTLLACLDGRPRCILSSPLRRALETAEVLARRVDGTVAVDERFREIPSPVPLARRQDWLRAFMRQRWSEQEETLQGWRDGIVAALGALPPDSVVFTHFLVLNTIAGWAQGRDETLVFWPANASVTRARYDGAGGWTVEPGEQMRTRVN